MQDEVDQVAHQLSSVGIGVESLAVGIHLTHLVDDLHHLDPRVVFHSRDVAFHSPFASQVEEVCQGMRIVPLRAIVGNHQVLEEREQQRE